MRKFGCYMVFEVEAYIVIQFRRYKGVDDERYGLDGFRLSDEERSTRFISVFRSETLKPKCRGGYLIRPADKRSGFEGVATYKARCMVRAEG